jgi:hypothetical protein
MNRVKKYILILAAVALLTLSYLPPEVGAVTQGDWYGSVSVEGSQNSGGGEYYVTAKPAVPSISFGSSGVGLSLPLPLTRVESVTTTVTGSNIDPQVTTATEKRSFLDTAQRVNVPTGIQNGVVSTTVTYAPHPVLNIAGPIGWAVATIADHLGLDLNMPTYSNTVKVYLP